MSERIETIETIESEGNDIVNDDLRLLHDGLLTANTTPQPAHQHTSLESVLLSINYSSVQQMCV